MAGIREARGRNQVHGRRPAEAHQGEAFGGTVPVGQSKEKKNSVCVGEGVTKSKRQKQTTTNDNKNISHKRSRPQKNTTTH